MDLLTTTIAHGTAHILEIPSMIVGAVAAAVAIKVPKEKSSFADQALSVRTLADIGVEPGSITWIN